MTAEEFGERLLALRDERGESGTEVAARAGIAPSTYYAIENGRRKARSATEKRLARAFGMSSEEFRERMSSLPGKGGSPAPRAAEEWQRTKAEQYEEELRRLRATPEKDFERWLELNARADFMRTHAASEALRDRFASMAAVAWDRAEDLFMQPGKATTGLEEKELVSTT